MAPADTPSLEDTDAAIAWLESLAAKQGVAEEELVMDPEARDDTPPEWVTELMSGMDDLMEEEAEVEPVIQEPLPDQPDWMTETLISDTMVPEEEETPAEAPPVEEWSLDTLERIDNEVEEIVPKSLDTRQLDLDWIQEEGAEELEFEEKAVEPALPEATIAEDWPSELIEDEVELPAALAEELTAEEIPDWLGTDETPEIEAEYPIPQPAETRELDAEWMRDTGIPEEVISEVADSEEPVEFEAPVAEIPDETLVAEALPDWMKISEVEEEPLQTEDPVPADEPEPAEVEEPGELEPEWMLETALPPEAPDEEDDIFDAEL